MEKVVLTAAIMDLCHEGHLNLLKEMRKAGDKVIVILHDDQSCYNIKGKIPIQDIWQRVNNLEITGMVDEIKVTYDTDPAREFLQVIRKYGRSNILFMRGDDNPDFPGKHVIDKAEIPIKLIPYTNGVSSTKLRDILCNY
jgi:cytidyltransferase-like protein